MLYIPVALLGSVAPQDLQVYALASLVKKKFTLADLRAVCALTRGYLHKHLSSCVERGLMRCRKGAHGKHEYERIWSGGPAVQAPLVPGGAGEQVLAFALARELPKGFIGRTVELLARQISKSVQTVRRYLRNLVESGAAEFKLNALGRRFYTASSGEEDQVKVQKVDKVPSPEEASEKESSVDPLAAAMAICQKPEKTTKDETLHRQVIRAYKEWVSHGASFDGLTVAEHARVLAGRWAVLCAKARVVGADEVRVGRVGRLELEELEELVRWIDELEPDEFDPRVGEILKLRGADVGRLVFDAMGALFTQAYSSTKYIPYRIFQSGEGGNFDEHALKALQDLQTGHLKRNTTNTHKTLESLWFAIHGSPTPTALLTEEQVKQKSRDEKKAALYAKFKQQKEELQSGGPC